MSEDGSACETVQSPCDEEKTEKPPLKGCPKRAITSSRSAKAPAPKLLKEGTPQKDQAPGAGNDNKLVKQDGMVESTRDQIDPSQHQASTLAQKKNKNKDDVPTIPEDPLVNEICRYQKSEDGASCVTVKEPCVKGATEVPPAGKCPARGESSTRSANPPVVKVEKAPAIDAPKTDGEKKEEKKEEKKAALAQKDEKKEEKKDEKKEAKKEEKKGGKKVEAKEDEKKEKTPPQKTGKKDAKTTVFETKKVEKKVSKESAEVEAYINEGEDKKPDPIPATPNQKANPNYCVYKAKADGEPHPDACACKYVKNDNNDCVQLTNDCFPAEKIPTNADCSA